MRSSAEETLKRDKHAYELLCNFIEQELLMPNQYDRSILDQYVNPRPRPVEMAGIYERLLVSAKNKGHGKRAIEKVCGSPVGHNSDEISEIDKELRRKWQVFRGVLCDFQPSMIAKTFNASELRARCAEALGPFEVGRHLCLFFRAAVAGAEWLANYLDAHTFYTWMDALNATSPAQLIATIDCIPGFGDALSRDFLKELGCINFVKPDTHIKNICASLRFSTNATPKEIDSAFGMMAANIGVSPYHLDKLFYLAASADFYHHPTLRSKFKRGRESTKRRTQLISHLEAHLFPDRMSNRSEDKLTHST